jgi:sulfur-carrier protein adenylyltransferase/sulfurtransferase
MILPGFGVNAQEKLLAAKVLLIGVGALGCPALQYLAGAGVGTIGIMDPDKITESNLHRQLLYTASDIGKLKTAIAANRIREQNEQVVVNEYAFAIDRKNALEIIAAYDLVIDATDNFHSKYLINDACAILGKPMIYGAVTRYEGQISVFNLAYKNLSSTNYRQLFPIEPLDGETGTCEQMGVLGVLPGIIGTMQAAEAIKIITGIGMPLVGLLYTYNMLQGKGYEFSIQSKQAMPALSRSEFLEMGNPIEQRNGSNCKDELLDLMDVEEINVAKFNELKNSAETFILDVREYHEYPSIDFADKQIPMSELDANISALPEKEICVICHQGIRSVYAAQQIQQHRGLKAYSLKGGLTAYFNQDRK